MRSQLLIMALRLLLLFGLLFGAVGAGASNSLRFVTWNVADNERMDKAFHVDDVRKLLGVENFDNKTKSYHDIYAISLQENCHLCNANNVDKLADIFLQQLNKEGVHTFEFVGHSATRVSDRCESIACNTGQHGSTSLLVIAKRDLAYQLSSFHINKCMGGWFKNSEKGIAAVELYLISSRKKICIAGVHLDSKEPKERRRCFDKFYDKFSTRLQGCEVIIYGGDFNTRTGSNPSGSKSRILPPEEYSALRLKDEMKGEIPYGGKQLLKFISAFHGRNFHEGDINFPPTYSVREPRECNYRWPCYRGDRPPSWTDRIICSSCQIKTYNILPIFKSDNMPVIGILDV